jgi:2-C-methyl-D-erythritol 4-phosphate cytidylyltransferase/2-C-methyl-D-erythritol 2,4-cyclodiphosphate synthase
MKIAALVLAAGNGSRFDSSIPKQFCMLHGKKVYRYPLDILLSSHLFSEVCLVINDSHFPYIDANQNHTIKVGGETRQKSVLLGIENLSADYVLICDGVRPFLNLNILKEHINKLKNGSFAVNTCILCADTINIKSGNTIVSIPPRDSFLRGQTPQSFCLKKLLLAHKNTSKEFTDDCGLMIEAGYPIDYVDGSDENIKITTSIDLEIASVILNKRRSFS